MLLFTISAAELLRNNVRLANLTDYLLVICFFVGESEALAVDEVNGFLYWDDEATIKRSTLKGNNVKDILDAGGKLHLI